MDPYLDTPQPGKIPLAPPIVDTPLPAPVPPPIPEPPIVSIDTDPIPGDTPLVEKIFGKNTGELGLTGIFVLGLLICGTTFQIIHYRRLIKSGGSYASLQKQINELKASQQVPT